MFARGGKWFVVLALVLTTGLHWAALQTVAWTSMLAGNLRGHTLGQAVDRTFDGQHPCPLCKAIAAARSAEKKSTVAPVLKMEFPPLAEKIVLIPPSRISPGVQVETLADDPLFSPPVPPPRAANA